MQSEYIFDRIEYLSDKIEKFESRINQIENNFLIKIDQVVDDKLKKFITNNQFTLKIEEI